MSTRRRQTLSQVTLWRKLNGVLQKDLAREMGQSSSTLSQKETGKLSWQQKDLELLYAKFGLSSDYVLGLTTGEDSEANNPEDRHELVMS